ncbi:MAG: AraC family transcriptional regulator, partial [Bacteroidota bacterium]
WISHFQSKNGDIVASEKPLSMDDIFLQKVGEIVQANLSDENFTVEKLGRTLRLDRTQLFRKLKALTGENPSHFIRTTRLKIAYQLLENQTATVAEIAFQVGFSNPSYFSRSFKQYFGKTPGEVRNNKT